MEPGRFYGRGHLHPIGYDLVKQPHIIAREAGKHSLLGNQGEEESMAFWRAEGESSSSHLALLRLLETRMFHLG